MPDVNGTPSDIELLEAALRRAMRRLRVHLPATVEEYDAATGTVSVRVSVSEYVRTDDGETPEHDPVIPRVPVQWVGGGGARLVLPLKRGDSGLLLFSDRALDEWKANTAVPVVARAKRQHHLADAFFAPGLRPPAAPWKGADGDAVRTDAVTLGYEGGQGAEGMQLHITPEGMALGEKDPAYAVALAETVKAELTALRNTVNALVTTVNTHTHTGVTTGAGVSGSLVPAQAASAPAAVQDMGSTTVKVKG